MRVICRWLSAAVSSGVVLVVGAACATPAGPGLPGPGADGWPGERSFIASSVTEDGVPKALVEGTRIMVSFDADGQVSANAGCNHMGGPGRVESGTLVVDGLAMTEMGCPDGLMEQDAWVADLLTSRPALRIDGDELTLSGSGIEMVLLDREIADPDRALVGTRWTVHTVFEGDSASSMIHPVPAVLTIDPSGSFLATTGCVGGGLEGTATISGDLITFTVSGDQACVGGGNAVDEAVRATLSGELTYEIEAGSLRLLRADGNGLGLAAEGAGGDGEVEIDCGTVTLDQGESPPPAMLTCLLDAVAAARSVHLTIVAPTVEGDLVPTTYRGDGTATILVIVDARQDRFGSGRLEYQTCEQPRVENGWLTFAQCTGDGTG